MNSRRGNSRRRRSSSYGPRRNSRRSGGRSRASNKIINPERFIKKAKPVEVTEYVPKHSFNDFQINDNLKSNLVAREFVTPTQIQDKAIPVALLGQDVVGLANTGTGKTAAFLLPILHKLMRNRDQKALIVAPTRELAMQIQQESRAFSKKCRIWDVLLIGGAPMHRQLRDLDRNPQVIIGTPGRIKDHLERKSLDLSDAETIVLDEVDRMLDMGFIADIRVILGQLPTQRQSLFFSATMSSDIERLIQQFTNTPVNIKATTAETSDNVEQSVIKYPHHDEKIGLLHDLLLEEHVSKTLVFSETKRSVEKLSKELDARGFKVDAIHGNKSQGQRQRALRNFKEDQVSVLIATDVAARGIDVDGISHVVNYDVPQSYQDYTHRIGRTGRGGSLGHAVTFVPHGHFAHTAQRK